MSIKNQLNIVLILLGFQTATYAQSSPQLGVLPVVNINKKVNDEVRLNFKTETRQILYQDGEVKWVHELVDFAGVVSKKTGINNSIAGGYLLRVEEGALIHRLIQQYAINRRYTSFRLSHRLSADQTFEPEEDTEFRFRYRLSSQFPLSGPWN